eukprot:jgi/Hompol1/4573/HPOL_003714-RA
MASNCVVDLDGYPLKKAVIKTTPAMSLKSIVTQACEKLSLADPDSYILKMKRQTLDLSLSVRFANLAPGAKLTLHKRSSLEESDVGNQTVDIAVQLEDGTRLVDKFPTSTTLWAILVHFETRSNGTLSITRRSGPPPSTQKGIVNKLMNLTSKPAAVYIQPVCMFLNREANLLVAIYTISQYNTIEVLKTTTLRSAGLESGNGAIRVVSLYTDRPIEEFMDEIEAVVTVAAPAGAAAASSKVRLPSAPQKPSVSSAAQSPSTSVAAEQSNASTSIAEASAPALQPTSTPAATATAEVQNTTVAHPRSDLLVHPTKTEAIKEPEQPIVELDIRIYLPPPDSLAPLKIDLPSSFYKLTATEMKMLMAAQQARNRQITDAPLMTKAMREREEEVRRQKHPKTMIRVRFPDRMTLQAVFWSGDSGTVFPAFGQRRAVHIVRQHLRRPDRPFTLYVTPPQKIIDPQDTFWKAQLAPASVVYFAWSVADPDSADEPALTAEALESAVPIPLPSNATDVRVHNDNGVESDAVLEDPDETELQREAERERERLRLMQASSTSGVDADADADGMDIDEVGGEDHAAGARKMPKWFRPPGSNKH